MILKLGLNQKFNEDDDKVMIFSEQICSSWGRENKQSIREKRKRKSIQSINIGCSIHNIHSNHQRASAVNKLDKT